MASIIDSPARPDIARVPAAQELSSKNSRIALTPANLRVWGTRSALSLIDQGCTSAASFGVNVLLARWILPEAYGAFAVAFAAFLFFAGFHNVLLLEPISVLGPCRHADRLPSYFRTQLRVHAVLVGALSLTIILSGLVLWRIAPRNPLVGAAIGEGIALPFMLLLWLARRMCYIVQRPSIAVVGSTFYLAFVVSGLFVLGRLGLVNSFTSFLLMGAGSLLAASVLAWSLGLFALDPQRDPDMGWRAALRDNWTYGRWLVGSILLFSISNQVQMFLVAGSLGLGAAGILRAMQIPSLAMTQVVTATGLLVLPTLSYDFGRGSTRRIHHKATLVTIALFAVTLSFAVLLAFEARPVERLLFGGKYEGYSWLMPLLALIPAVNGISTGYSMALRASQKPRFDLISNLFAAPVALVSAFVFMRAWGLAGAVTSMLLSYAVSSTVTIIFFRKASQEQPATALDAGVLQ